MLSLSIQKAENLKDTGRYLEAIKVCEQILFSDLDCAEAYEEIGDNYLFLGMESKAIKALKRAVLLSPDSANAHYLIGFAYSRLGRYRSSTKHLERANVLHPNHHEILRCLGWSYFHQKAFREKGLNILKQANYNAPNDVLILNDLGVCYVSLNEFEKAIETFKKTLSIDPHNKTAKELIEEIKFSILYEKVFF